MPVSQTTFNIPFYSNYNSYSKFCLKKPNKKFSHLSPQKFNESVWFGFSVRYVRNVGAFQCYSRSNSRI